MQTRMKLLLTSFGAVQANQIEPAPRKAVEMANPTIFVTTYFCDCNYQFCGDFLTIY